MTQSPADARLCPGMKVEHITGSVIATLDRIVDDQAYLRGPDFAFWVPLKSLRTPPSGALTREGIARDGLRAADADLRFILRLLNNDQPSNALDAARQAHDKIIKAITDFHALQSLPAKDDLAVSSIHRAEAKSEVE